ncbi:DoxX family protein [Streptomyces sp. NBC_00448]|uniref:DoxX family protein n=1 Tax=Streptomyces sp. NBC_00448 TaxID=2903652 RepID=UPI002E1FA0C6
MFALSAVLTALLLLEVVPSALAALARFGPGVERLDSLTRLGLREGRHRWVPPAAGLLHTACAVLLLIGIWHPGYGVLGAALEVLYFGWVLARQLAAGDRGRPLFAYALFTGWSALVLLVAALRH